MEQLDISIDRYLRITFAEGVSRTEWNLPRRLVSGTTTIDLLDKRIELKAVQPKSRGTSRSNGVVFKLLGLCPFSRAAPCNSPPK